MDELKMAALSSSTTRGSSSSSNSSSFPCKLHRMLTDVDRRQDGLEQCVSWAPHGRCFLIKDKQTFMMKVMPTYFYQLKYNSFQRQLNLHGFKKIQGQGPDKGGYYHECFLRGLPQLAETIRRSKANHKSADSTSTKIKSSCEGEPNFYAMPPLPGGGGVRSNNQDVRTKLQGGVESTTESSIEDAPFQGRSWIPCVGSTTAKNEQVPAATGTSFKQDKVPKTKLVDAATNWVLANTKGFLQGTKVPASASRNQPSQVPMTSLPVPFPNSRNPVVGAGDTGITTRQDPMKLLQRGSSSSSNTMDSFARPENQFNGFWNNPIFQDPPHPTMLCRSSSSSMASSSSSSNSSFLPQQQQQQQQAPTSAYSLSAILEPTPIAPTALLRVQSARSVNASSHPTLQDTTQGPGSFYAAVGCMPSYANHGAVKDEEEEDSFAYLSRLLSKNMDDTGTALNLASLSSSKDHFF